MRILLDTCILLWWLNDDPALSAAGRNLISNPRSIIYVSAVSLWEIWLKHSLGKLVLPPHFEMRLGMESFERLPLTWEHTRHIAKLPFHHRDPFDRMLIAQAQAEGMLLLSADRETAEYGDCVVTC